VATNANSENARSRVEASSAGKREYGDERRFVKHLARLGWISPRYGLLSLGARLESYEMYISLIFIFRSGRGKLLMWEMGVFLQLVQINARSTKQILYAHPGNQSPSAIRNYK
jgi:hypothetical protein